jgi:hypothetical protein
MNDSTKTIIKILGVAAGAYLLYEFLQKSGMWAQWFGSAAVNSFTDPAKLLAYCAANPTGSATYVDSSGKPSTAPCAQWLAANAQAPAPTTTTTTTTTTPPAHPASVAPAAGSTLIARLQALAFANPALGQDKATVDQWNWILTHEWPNTVGIDSETPAGHNAIGAAEYVGYYLALGLNDPTLATAGGGAGMSGYADDPYAWVQ